jgi:hypothetical protein
MLWTPVCISFLLGPVFFVYLLVLLLREWVGEKEEDFSV